jgi:cell division septal protein FtsQ
MTRESGGAEKTVAEAEAQRAAEQEALRKVRHLTDELEAEQRARRRLQRWALLIGALALLGIVYVAVAIYLKATSAPPPAKIEIPGTVVVPSK